MTTTLTLTPEMLLIPRRLTSKYARRAHEQGIDRDDLLGIAHLAFAEALANYDPTRGHQGEDGLGPYLVQRVEWRVKNAIWVNEEMKTERWWRYSRKSLDAPLEPGSTETFHLTVGRLDPAFAALENAEEAAALLALLPDERWRLVVLLIAQGETFHQIGEALGGMPANRVYDLLVKARALIVRELRAKQRQAPIQEV